MKHDVEFHEAVGILDFTPGELARRIASREIPCTRRHGVSYFDRAELILFREALDHVSLHEAIARLRGPMSERAGAAAETEVKPELELVDAPQPAPSFTERLSAWFTS